MSDLSLNVDTDDLSSSSSKPISNPTDFDLTASINGTSTSTNNIFGISDETLRVLLITIGIIVFLLCLIICISVCVCVCIKRRRKTKRKGKEDHLLPEPVAKTSFSKSAKAPLNNNNAIPQGKQTASNQPASTTTTTTGKPFYYENLDDIPFIDESRPTSVVDITQV